MSIKTNDEKIMLLKEQIAEKKMLLKKSKRFAPITNCILDLDDKKINIQAMPKDQLTSVLIKLNMYALSAKDLNVLDEYLIGGYKINEWIEDIKARLDVLSRKEEEKKLKAMEGKLHVLLSNEKKVELEIDAIESILKK